VEFLDGSEEGGVLFKAAVYGESGSGKSTLGVTAPKPLILLSERQGYLPIKQAAKRMGVEVPEVILCTTLEDYRLAVRALFGRKDKPFQIRRTLEGGGSEVLRELRYWPQTVVLDSLTDVCRIVSEDIRRASPPKSGRDGLPVDSERYWNVLGERITNLIHGFRDAPVHTLFLALKDDRETGDEGDKRRWVGPSLAMRKLPAVLSAACNLTAYAYRREHRKDKRVENVYGVMTTGPEYMMLKPCRPLRDVEVPDFAFWVRAIAGELEEMPPAPATSAESLASSLDEQATADYVAQKGQEAEERELAAHGVRPASSAPANEPDGRSVEDLERAAIEQEPNMQAVSEVAQELREQPPARATRSRSAAAVNRRRDA
jgi:hypothetical protein